MRRKVVIFKKILVFKKTYNYLIIFKVSLLDLNTMILTKLTFFVAVEKVFM